MPKQPQPTRPYRVFRFEEVDDADVTRARGRYVVLKDPDTGVPYLTVDRNGFAILIQTRYRGKKDVHRVSIQKLCILCDHTPIPNAILTRRLEGVIREMNTAGLSDDDELTRSLARAAEEIADDNGVDLAPDDAPDAV